MKKITRLLSVFIVIAALTQTAGLARADTLDELQKKQAEVDRKIEANRASLETKKQQVKDTQSVIANLNAQIASAENDISLSTEKINLTNQEIKKLEEQIAQKEQELAIQKENLYESMRVIYETPHQSTVEIVVGSNSLSEIVDRGQYIESLNYRIETAIKTITKIKSDLENSRNRLEKERADLEEQKNALVEKKKGLDLQKNQKNSLLNQSLAEQTSFQTTLSALMAEHSQIAAEIYAARASRGGIFTGSSDYPFLAIDIPDPWSFLTRECTSYAAWYWNAKLGENWYNTQVGRGSARYWDEIAGTLGHPVSSTPQVYAFVVWRGPLYAGDQWGHVAIVEKVNADGSIDISEFNWLRYSYSYRTGVHPGDYGAYYYIYP